MSDPSQGGDGSTLAYFLRLRDQLESSIGGEGREPRLRLRTLARRRGWEAKDLGGGAMQVVRANGSVVAVVDPFKSSVETWLTCSVRRWLQVREGLENPSVPQLRAASTRIPREFGQGSLEVWSPHDPPVQPPAAGAPLGPIWRADDRSRRDGKGGAADVHGSSQRSGEALWIGAGFRVVEAQFEERSGSHSGPWAPTITLSLEARGAGPDVLRLLDFCDRYGQPSNFIDEIGRSRSRVN